MSITLNEIRDQYAALDKTLSLVKAERAGLASFFEKAAPEKILFTGCGSSFSLACAMRSVASTRTELPVYALASGDLWLNCASYKNLLKNALVVSLTRSGRTSELIKAVEAVRALRLNSSFLSVICDDDTPLEEISDYTLRLPWAFDKSVCQTRCVSNLFAGGALLIGAIFGDDKLFADFRVMADNGDGYLERLIPRMEKLAAEGWECGVVVADGPIDGLAEEGALAFKEISQLQSNYYHLLDVRHGPMVLVGKKTLFIARVSSPANPQEIRLVEDAVKKGARVIVSSNLPVEIPGAENIAFGKDAGCVAGGLALLNICQIVTFFKSGFVGCNPDLPDGLDAWIEIK